VVVACLRTGRGAGVLNKRIIAGIGAVALVAGGAVVAPALGAMERAAGHTPRRGAVALRGLGTFTPAAADPRLAAVYARGGLDIGDFRFTPADSKRDNRAVTVAVRARSNRSGRSEQLAVAPVPATVGLTPIAYNLGVAVGWKRIAVAGEVSRVDLASQPGSREAADLAVSYNGKRFSGRLKAVADRPIGDTPVAIADPQTYSVDLGGSYSLTRNLDVTAGLRYRSDRERLARVSDDRRDSQAVYVGTAFRF
jgi:hypothetical protein